MATKTKPERKTHYLGGFVPLSLRLAVEKIALEEDRPMSWVLQKFLTEGVTHRKEKQKVAS